MFSVSGLAASWVEWMSEGVDGGRQLNGQLFQKIEEMPGYDLSQFVADMGGSLGFLLGLSVLGLIGVFEKVSDAGAIPIPKCTLLVGNSCVLSFAF